MRIDEYFPRHRKRVQWLAGGCATISATLITLALIVAGNTAWWLAIFYVGLPVLLTATIMLIIMQSYALEPLSTIMRAVVHMSGQASDTTPPDINTPSYQRNGLKAVLQTIYNTRTMTTGVSDSQSDTETAELLPIGVVCIDTARNIIYSNSHAPISHDTSGRPFLTLHFPDEDPFDGWMQRASEQMVTGEHRWPRVADKQLGEPERKIYDVIARYRKGAQDGYETILVTVDRTEQYSHDEESMDFIALAAHELRGPITVIRGYLDVLGEELAPSLQPQQRELIDRLTVSANRLSGYVSNILNVSRYDRQHLQLHLVEDTLSSVYATIADDLSLRASTQNRLLSVSIPTDLPTIAADRNSLTEVLANLVDNAIKYSREGGHVSVESSVDGDFVRCRVTDQGIGIPAAVVGHLFQKFYRSHRSSESVSGSGLGLYLCRAVVESHGGHIEANSTEGQGSIFTFWIPTYASVADKLATGDNSSVIRTTSGWIKNHAMYRG